MTRVLGVAVALFATAGLGAAPARDRLLIANMEPSPDFMTFSSPNLSGQAGRVFAKTVSGPMGATKIRVQFSASGTSASKWVLRAFDPNRQLLATFELKGAAEPQWTEELATQTAVLVVTAPDGIEGSLVLSVTALSHGIQLSNPEGVIGTYQIKPISLASQPILGWGSAVARIRYMSRGAQYVCTGFMVTADLMLTNRHCIATEDERRSASFDFHADADGWPGETYYASSIQASSEALDYSVLKLKGAPGGRHGTLALSTRGLEAGRALVTIHHPLGEPKRFTQLDCTATELDVPGRGTDPTDFRHLCDTQRGSSGAPVIDFANRVVVGLHHLGCDDATCNEAHQLVNQGVDFGRILRDIHASNPGLAKELGYVEPGQAITEDVPPEPLPVRVEATTGPAPAPSPPEPSWDPPVEYDADAIADAAELEVEAFEPATLPGSFGPRFSIQEENDAFGLTQSSDNYYSQGLRVDGRWRPADRLRLFKDRAVIELWGLQLAQNIYTPTSIDETALPALRLDRPYAGYLFVGAVVEAAFRRVPFFLGPRRDRFDAMSFLTLDLNVGVTGPIAFGGPVQTSWHALLRSASGRPTPRQPQGWGIYETANRPSLDGTVRGQADVIRLGLLLGRFSSFTGSGLALVLAPRARVDLGTLFVAAGVGLEARAGLMGGFSALSAPRFVTQLYAFARADGRWVPYNGLISGTLLNGVTSGVSSALGVGELTVGARLRLAKAELAFTQVWRTSEVTPTPGPRIHNYGQFNLSLLFDLDGDGG